MRTCPLNSILFLSWLRLSWMVGEALDVGGGDSDRAASYQEQLSHWGHKATFARAFMGRSIFKFDLRATSPDQTLERNLGSASQAH